MTRKPAIVRSVFDEAVREINDLERRIVDAEDDTDAKLWKQAKKVAEQLTRMSQRELASQWINLRTREPYSYKHVQNTAGVVAAYLNMQPRPRFREAYNRIANAKPDNPPPPFHWLLAVGDLRKRVETFIAPWPDDARELAPKALRDLADILEVELHAGRGEGVESAQAGADTAIEHGSQALGTRGAKADGVSGLPISS